MYVYLRMCAYHCRHSKVLIFSSSSCGLLILKVHTSQECTYTQCTIADLTVVHAPTSLPLAYVLNTVHTYSQGLSQGEYTHMPYIVRPSYIKSVIMNTATNVIIE